MSGQSAYEPARAQALLWLGLALIACLSVALINGTPLFYYDSPAYVDQGSKILTKLGFGAQSTGAGGAGAGVTADNSVNGSRSAVFSVIAAVLVRIRGLGLIPVANLVLVLTSVWLTVRAVKGAGNITVPNSRLIALPLLAACAGSLPFYVAFIMPDMLAAVLLLMVSVLAIYADRMGKWELALAFGLGALAVVSHISHIAIAAALVPVVALVGWGMGNRKWWLATLLVGLMVIAGVGERLAFKVAAKSVAGAEVVYIPFLTARLIEDGPGYRYLTDKCPSEDLQTCALFDALSKSDDPMRLTASHIIFEPSAQLGSFRLMPQADQAAVAGEQYRFFLSVLANEPVGTITAIIRNTAVQAGLFSVEMTIPTDHILGNTHAGYAQLQDQFSHGRLSANRQWLPGIDIAHTGVYALSALAIGLGFIWKAPQHRAFKGFVIMVLLGITANAFVCGAVSQPADRYGARVIWLLPFLATILAILWASERRRVDQ